MTTAICFDNLTLGYERHPAIHHLTGEVAQGALLAVVGPNGAGKSTLLKGIAGMLQPLGGRVRRDICRPEEIAYLPQQAAIDRTFPINVYDFVAMGLWRRTGLFGRISRSHRQAIAYAIHRVGLDGFERRTIGTLSGGQMQRTLFARVALQDSPLVLLDEPFTAIDQKATRDLIHVVQEWHAGGRTVVAVLHDLDLVRETFPQTLILAREPVAWGDTEELLCCGDHMARARSMMEAWDDHAAVCEREAA